MLFVLDNIKDKKLIMKRFDIGKKIFFLFLISVLVELLSACGVKDVLYLSSEAITSNIIQEDKLLLKDI